jgi:hypothetical protein
MPVDDPSGSHSSLDALRVLWDAERSRLADERDRRYQERYEAQRELAAERDRRYQERFTAQEEALRVARESWMREIAGVNELRGQLNDVIDTKAEKGETNIRIDGVDRKVDELTKTVTSGGGRSAGLNAGWGYLLGAIGALALLYSILSHLGTKP